MVGWAEAGCLSKRLTRQLFGDDGPGFHQASALAPRLYPTDLHPFNAYRHLRQVNPSPYTFYLDCGELQIVGASPETLCKVEANKVFNHAIAGTTKRGKSPDGSFYQC